MPNGASFKLGSKEDVMNVDGWMRFQQCSTLAFWFVSINDIDIGGYFNAYGHGMERNGMGYLVFFFYVLLRGVGGVKRCGGNAYMGDGKRRVVEGKKWRMEWDSVTGERNMEREKDIFEGCEYFF